MIHRMGVKAEMVREMERLTGRAGMLPPQIALDTDQRWGGRPDCSNPGCSKGWTRFLKDWRRPVFEGQWGCSADCMKTIVQKALRREIAEEQNVQADHSHRHRVPLGLILLAQGMITHSQLQHALDMQRRAGRGRIGSWLVSECGVKEERVMRALGLQWNCPVLPIEGFDAPAMALLAPRELVKRVGMLPLRIAGGHILYLGFEDELDASAAFAMERMSGMKVKSGLVDGEQLKAAWHRLRNCVFVDSSIERVDDIETLSIDIAFALGKLQPRASRLVHLHQYFWLRMWLETGAMSTREGGIPATRADVVDRIYTIG